MNLVVIWKSILISRDTRLSVKISQYLRYTASITKTYFLLYWGRNDSAGLKLKASELFR